LTAVTTCSTNAARSTCARIPGTDRRRRAKAAPNYRQDQKDDA
jgi:hypothetical protein